MYNINGQIVIDMNLFILSLLQKEIAEAMMDKHISKIILDFRL